MPASKKEAKEFVKRWKKRLGAIPAGSNNEQQDTQKFWVDLLINVLGIPSNTIDSFVDFERKVRGRRIDVFVSDHNFLCEQKSWGIDLDKPEPRNGGMETPLQQAMWYARHLPYSERPRWVMTCNFGTFRLYDLDNERPEDTVQEFSLEELPDSLYLLSFLTSNETSRLHKEQQLSIEAGAYVSRLYDALAKQYHHIEEKDERAQEEQRSLNVLITRIIFLLYAEDADLLQSHQAFGRYCEGDPAKLRRKLVDLFETIDTPLDQRDEYMDEDLAAFPYVNGGLFADSSIIVPQMTPEILEAITDASQDFDWREISGVIFGGVFEGTLNPETRHAGGMHYTSVENIERCLKPLFLDELWDELHEAEGERTAAKRKQALARLHDKVASITIGDPACGSGNFLTEAYRQLRTIENRIIEDELNEETDVAGQTSLSAVRENPIRVSLDQLFGIEINDFAVSVAKTALWITEEQMLRKTQEIYVDYDFDFLPLRSLSNLHEGNALKADWSEVFPGNLTYIVGNPPFLGSSVRTKEQTADLEAVFGSEKKWGKCDYCVGWYKKASNFMRGKNCHAALVSTNSITQGEQVEPTWKRLFDEGIVINFAYRTFIWDNEATDKAHVHCVIVGFSYDAKKTRRIFESDGTIRQARNINGYLVDAPNMFLRSRGKPVDCFHLHMTQGSKPVDGGNLILSENERSVFIAKHPELSDVIKPFIGAREFMSGKPRYCFWLKDVSPVKFMNCCDLMDRLNKVRETRLASPTKEFNACADKPMLFVQDRQPENDYLVLPRTTSGRRKYLPLGFNHPDIIASDKLIIMPDATLYDFGLLSSTFHMAWIRTVSGRLKSDYEYSSGVYNNFAYPNCGNAERREVERAAATVLDVRRKYLAEGAKLADLYDPDKELIFSDLIEAHKALDAAVEAAYGVDFDGDEEKIVAHLFNLYAERVGA